MQRLTRLLTTAVLVGGKILLATDGSEKGGRGGTALVIKYLKGEITRIQVPVDGHWEEMTSYCTYLSAILASCENLKAMLLSPLCQLVTDKMWTYSESSKTEFDQNHDEVPFSNKKSFQKENTLVTNINKI